MRIKHDQVLAAIAGVVLGGLLFETWVAEVVLLGVPALTALAWGVLFVVRTSGRGGTSDRVMMRLLVGAVVYIATVASARYVVCRIAVREADGIVADVKSYRAQHHRYPESLDELPEGARRVLPCRYPVSYHQENGSFDLEISLPWAMFDSGPIFESQRDAWDE